MLKVFAAWGQHSAYNNALASDRTKDTSFPVELISRNNFRFMYGISFLSRIIRSEIEHNSVETNLGFV